MKINIISNIKNTKNSITNTTKRVVELSARKSAAALKLGAGIAGDITAITANIAGGAIAVSGAVVALAGFGVYVAGTAVMHQADRLANASQALASAGYDELAGRTSDQEIVEVEEVAPAAPFGFQRREVEDTMSAHEDDMGGMQPA